MPSIARVSQRNGYAYYVNDGYGGFVDSDGFSRQRAVRHPVLRAAQRAYRSYILALGWNPETFAI